MSWGSVDCGPAVVRGRDPIGCVRERPWPFERECERCSQPLQQKLIDRTNEGGETWTILKCNGCNAKR